MYVTVMVSQKENAIARIENSIVHLNVVVMLLLMNAVSVMDQV